MRHELGAGALGRDLRRGLAERERLRLREQVGDQQILVRAELVIGLRAQKPMKSIGTSVVPWCSSWKYAC